MFNFFGMYFICLYLQNLVSLHQDLKLNTANIYQIYRLCKFFVKYFTNFDKIICKFAFFDILFAKILTNMADFETKRDRTKRIMKSLLHALDMNVSELSDATGIGYMGLYYLNVGRTREFPEETIDAICLKFPTISRDFLTTGIGSPFLDGRKIDEEQSLKSENALLEKITSLLDRVLSREEAIDKKIVILEERISELKELEARQNK